MCVSAAWGVWWRCRCSSGSAVQRSWRGGSVEGVSARSSWSSAHQRALFCVHQLCMWEAFVCLVFITDRTSINLSDVCAALNGTERHATLQLLVCLLPACNSDTLQCLLHFLSKVANHAEDSRDGDGHEVCSADWYWFWILIRSLCFLNSVSLD